MLAGDISNGNVPPVGPKAKFIYFAICFKSSQQSDASEALLPTRPSLHIALFNVVIGLFSSYFLFHKTEY